MSEIELVFDSEDFARLQRTLAKLDQEHIFKPMANAIGMDIRGVASVYPPASEANRPPYPFYERGWGTRTGPNSGRQTSERLSTKWYHTVFPDYLKIGNTASYAGYVHGEEQNPIHAHRGWKKLLAVAKERLPGIIRKLEAQALKVWESTQ
jgi:hypothetical protein